MSTEKMVKTESICTFSHEFLPQVSPYAPFSLTSTIRQTMTKATQTLTYLITVTTIWAVLLAGIVPLPTAISQIIPLVSFPYLHRDPIVSVLTLLVASLVDRCVWRVPTRNSGLEHLHIQR